LLWTDLPLTGPADVDVERGTALATALGRHYGNAPALAAVTVHDDPVTVFDRPLGSGLLDRLRFRWQTWRASYDHSAANAIADSLPATVPTFPVVGPPGIDPDAVGLYPGWQYGDVAALEWVRQRHPDPAVVAEFGAGSLGVESPAELAGFDRRTHDTRTDPDDVEASQEYQARVCKHVAERLRQDGTPMLAAVALRDTGDAGMGVYKRDGAPKTAADALAGAFEPVQATLVTPDGDESDVVVHNDLDRRFTGTLTWESPAGSGSADVTVDTNGRARITTIDLPKEGQRVKLTVSLSDRAVRNEYRI
jgi:hypothetical protein